MGLFKTNLSTKEVINKLSSRIKITANAQKYKIAKYPKENIKSAKISIDDNGTDTIMITISDLNCGSDDSNN